MVLTDYELAQLFVFQSDCRQGDLMFGCVFACLPLAEHHVDACAAVTFTPDNAHNREHWRRPVRHHAGESLQLCSRASLRAVFISRGRILLTRAVSLAVSR
jgi:hypothetical protein